MTFLFTDVEGSTRLLAELGSEGYARELASHRRALREAFAAHGGVEVDTQGDAFFVAFSTASGALDAAAEATEAISGGRIKIRAGIHTGTPHLSEEGYVGIDVHRAARIAACGHGGQVLVSASAATLLPSARLTDLGSHRLKDLSAPERIHQLGDRAFPPLKSLHQTNLPVPSTPFLGRERELLEVVALAEAEGRRLLTLTGPGGTGKTRLALQAAGELAPSFEAGTWWVSLAAVRESGLVLEEAARVLGAKDSLAEHIGSRSMLLLFDNFEQVIEAAPDVSALLARCPNLVVLATSREPLRIAGEQEYRVEPFVEEEGVAFFVAKARAFEPDFEPDERVTAICARLDNLPLALELAAARVKVLSTAQILERLGKRLPLLGSGGRDAPERQRTLRAAIEWSYDLLSPEERALFARLGIFEAGATLDALERVVGAELDQVQSLVDKSLLRETGGRLWMLETIREYAVERLVDSSELPVVSAAHAAYFLALVEEAAPHLRGEPKGWLNLLDEERDNIRAALDRLEDTQQALRFVAAATRFWVLRGYPAEGRRRSEDALAADRSPTAARANALCGAALLAFEMSDTAAGLAWAREAIDVAADAGDEWAETYARFLVGQAAVASNDFESALDIFSGSIQEFEALGDDHYAMIAQFNAAWMRAELGDRSRAIAMHRENLERAKALGNRRIESLLLAVLAQDSDVELVDAVAMLYEAYTISSTVGDQVEAVDIVSRLAGVFVERGDPELAARLLACNTARLEEIGGTRFWVASRNEAILAAIRMKLDDDVFDAAWAAGRRLSLEGAVALALAAPHSVQAGDID